MATQNNSVNAKIIVVASGATSTTMQTNTTYVLPAITGSTVTYNFTLPSSPIIGDFVEILGTAASVAVWSISNNSTSEIRCGYSASSGAGTGGIAAKSFNDSYIKLRYFGLNPATSAPTWAVIAGIGNFRTSTTGGGLSNANIINNQLGVTDASTAQSGYVGELISSIISSGSAVPFTTTIPLNVTTITLTAGDYDLWGNVFFANTGVFTQAACWIGVTSATQPDNSVIGSAAFPSGVGNLAIVAPGRAFNISTTTIVYLSAFANFTTGTVTGCGGVYARRRR